METRTRNETNYSTREMLIDGQVVCWLTLIDYGMRIGSARVRMAGIAGVETKREYRMKGYMRVLFQDTLEYMRHEGFDVSMLFGIPHFYPKFGYATCMALYKVSVKTRNAELAKGLARPLQARPITPADLPAVAELYNRANASRSCSLVRPQDVYKGFTQGSGWWLRAESAVFEDREHRFVGYAAWDKNDQAVNVMELEAADKAFYPSLLIHFVQQAIDKRCEAITFNTPPDHPFAQYLRRFGCECSITYPHHADGMLRIMNQATLFEKLRPELERRLSMARLGQAPGTVIVRTDLGETTLSFGAPDCAELELPQDKLIQLITGYRNLHDLLSEPDVKASPGSEPMLDALFPQGHPYVWLGDQF